ncbi:MAG TPA: AlkA N-terminal domain-containing protein, partial [Nitrospiraceae bacterium]|nr:AlkA N-terminal domain-containing protein [Nitrospiraceae bacterium]
MTLRFSLDPVPPFRLDLTVWTLRRRPINAVDVWDGKTYRRGLVFDNRPVEIAVTQTGSTLEVTVTGARLVSSSMTSAVTMVLQRMLGTDVDLKEFYDFASQDPKLNQLVHRFRGAKPPRFPSIFEALVNGISCQQLSLTVGITLLNRLAKYCGLAAGSSIYCFPRPEDLVKMTPAEFRRLGYSGNKSRALLELSHTILDGRLNLETLVERDDQEITRVLLELRGIGRWTAEYALLRGVGKI